MIPSQEDIKKLHNGLISCPWEDVWKVMPEVWPIIQTFPGMFCPGRWVVDVKIHMLMPGQYPCIPNWHEDFIPRNEDGDQMPWAIKPECKMYLWLSGPPFTEFKDGREVKAGEWIEFDQNDTHRGTVSEEHQWRMMIRISDRKIAPFVNKDKDVFRRHTQVYLDADNFRW